MPKATGRTGFSFERRLSTAPPPPRLARAAQLVEDVAAGEGVALLHRVRVDAADEMRVRLLKRRRQLVELAEEVRRHRREPPALVAAALLRVLLLLGGELRLGLRHHRRDERVGGGLEDELEVGVQHVVVLLQEALGVVPV